MRRCASLGPHQAGLKFGREGLDLRTPKLGAENLLPLSIDAVGVKTFLAISRPTVTGCII